MTPVVWLANSAVFEASLSGAELLALVPSVAAVSAGFELLFLIGPVTGRRTRVAAVSDELPKATFQQRLPLPLRSSEIEALKAEDHYLRVYTSRGSTLLRMRLSDAVAELGTHSGLRTHRSWWVAESAIKGTLHQQGKVRLLTNCGVEVPVSRSATRSIGNMAFAAVEQRAAHD
jgi:DNA-binding LytR/AlgR family response regulator